MNSVGELTKPEPASDPRWLEWARRVDAVEAAAWVDQFNAAPAALAEQLGLRTAQVAGAALLMAPRIPFTLFNRAIGVGATTPVREDDLDTVVQTFRAAGVEKFWIHVNPLAAPRELPTWLEARRFGLAPRKTWSKMVRLTAPAPEIPTDLVVREVGRDAASHLSGVLTRAHEMPSFVSLWLEALVGRAGWRAYVAYDGNQPVSGGFLFHHGTEGWLGMGGTIPSHRRRGGQRAILARRIADAMATGCTLLATETGDPLHDEKNQSLANMFFCGFERVCQRWNYENLG